MSTQFDLIDSAGPIRLALEDADVSLNQHFISAHRATGLLTTLILETPWSQAYLSFAGKRVQVPRLQCWVGDKSSQYGYSGISLTIEPWSKILLDLKDEVENAAHCRFNSVLLNYYRTGVDSVAWHSDNEKELGRDPIIASLSFGASRLFELKHRPLKRNNKNSNKRTKLHCQLSNGSLLIMGKGVQSNWLHQVPKQKEISQPRVNLTFRTILT